MGEGRRPAVWALGLGLLALVAFAVGWGIGSGRDLTERPAALWTLVLGAGAWTLAGVLSGVAIRRARLRPSGKVVAAMSGLGCWLAVAFLFLLAAYRLVPD